MRAGAKAHRVPRAQQPAAGLRQLGRGHHHGRRDGRWVHPSPTLLPVLRPSSLPNCACHHDRDPVYYLIWVIITGVWRRDGRRVRQTTPVGGHGQNDDSHRPVVNEVTGVEIVDLLPVCGWYHACDLVYYRVGVVITFVEMVGPIKPLLNSPRP